MAAVAYFDLVREMENAFNHRLRLVRSAQCYGIKKTAREFATTVPTVRKWLRRFQDQGLAGLQERSRAPHRAGFGSWAVVKLARNSKPRETPSAVFRRSYWDGFLSLPKEFLLSTTLLLTGH